MKTIRMPMTVIAIVLLLVLVGLALQLSVLLIPPLRGVFSVVLMDGAQWMTVLLLAVAPVPVCEVCKLLGQRKTAPGSVEQEKRDRAAK